MAKGNGASIGDADLGVERELPCKLTETELLERGDSLAAAELEIEKLKVERREVNRQINVHVDARNKLAHTIDSGEEMRKVVCKWIADYEHNVWNLVRQDSGDQVEQRTMTAADRQAGLPFPADDEPIGDVEVVELDPAAEAVEAGVVEVDGDTEVPDKPTKKKRAAKKSAKGKSKAKGKSARAYA